MLEHTPLALTIAGFDTCAGAGLQADLLTFHNHGYHPLTAATSLVVETPLQVRHCEALSAELLYQQIELLLATYPVAAIKIGLLASPAQVLVVREILDGSNVPIVLDPVGISTTGTSLQEHGTTAAIRKHLAPLVTLLTPNLPEARLLLDDEDGSEPGPIALRLADVTGTPVLLTGGHSGGDGEICDFLAADGQLTSFCGARIDTSASLHGTGCVLSSAIAAFLGKGETFTTAIEGARRYLREAMSHHHHFSPSLPLLALNHGLAGRHDQ